MERHKVNPKMLNYESVKNQKSKGIKIDMLPPEDEVENQPKDWVDTFTEEWYEASEMIKKCLAKEKSDKMRKHKKVLRTSGSVSYLGYR